MVPVHPSRIMEKEYFDNCQRVKTGIIDRIPVEVLTDLFEYLPLNDRKNVRRVCRRWFEASSIKKFQRKEKLGWDGPKIDFNVFDQIMRESSREIWNFEFRDTLFNILPEKNEKFFERQGSQINSLTFKDCVLTQNMLKSIIIYCDNLREISLDDTGWKSFTRSLFSGLGPETRLDDVIRSGIRRESLKTFKIRVYVDDRPYLTTPSFLYKGSVCPQTFLTDEFFRDVRILYPKIEEFTFDIVNEIKIIGVRGYTIRRCEYLLHRSSKNTNHVCQEYIPAWKAKFAYPELLLNFDLKCLEGTYDFPMYACIFFINRMMSSAK